MLESIGSAWSVEAAGESGNGHGRGTRLEWKPWGPLNHISGSRTDWPGEREAQ